MGAYLERQRIFESLIGPRPYQLIGQRYYYELGFGAITIYPKNEGTYNYYDWITKGKPLGQFKAVRVGIGGGD
jgi:hypothetical protein